MNNRERINAILHYQPYDHMPVVSFGYWEETLDKWAAEGHIPKVWADGYRQAGDACGADREIMKRLGFDLNWNTCVGGWRLLRPDFGVDTLEIEPDGSKIVRNEQGLIVRVNPKVVSIPSEIGTTLTDRKAWEKHYLPKLQFDDGRINDARFKHLAKKSAERDTPLGLHLGSLYGDIRNMLGVQQMAYIAVDDEALYTEIIDTVADLCYRIVERALTYGIQFDYAHFWEDICFRNGPLINPRVFREKVGPHYRRITELVRAHGIDIVSVDCDGCIDKLVPIWLENGVNTMFPIEVGVWKGSIEPWRKQYGRELRGVGGMDKRVFSQDKIAIDREVWRLKQLVALGGYIPCPDHRIPPDAKFELVQYYCDRFRQKIQ